MTGPEVALRPLVPEDVEAVGQSGGRDRGADGASPVPVVRVRQAPGIVTGYRLGGSDPRTSHRFVVVDDRVHAESFASGVRGNALNQAAAGVSTVSLDLAEVAATT
jgi:hypothetical protein